MMNKRRENFGGSSKLCYLLSLIVALTVCSARAVGQDCSYFASNYRQAVVSLSVEKTKNVTGEVVSASGTGFIVSAAGHVLTAYHIVAADAKTDDLVIYGALGNLYAPKLPMRVVAEDKSSDVALLQFKDTARSYTPVALGDPWGVKVGSQLCSLSFSAPLKEDYHATTGTLSSRDSQDEQAGVRNLWLTQMPSNFGESGAPVLDLATGGVVALKYGGKDPSKAQNVNYLIPLNLADALIRAHVGGSAKIVEPDPEAHLSDAQKKARGYLREAADYRKAKQYQQALAYYDLAIEADSKLLLAYLQRAGLHLFLKEYESAISDSTEALKLDPKNPVAFIHRGHAYDKLGKYAQEAENYTEMLKAVGPDDWFVRRQRGVAYRKKGDLDLAIADLSEAIRLKPDDYEAYFERGYAYRKKREYDKAIEDLTRSLRFSPDYGAAYYQRGMAYKQKGDGGDEASYDKAIADFDRAENHRVSSVYLYVYRGQAYAKKGKYKEAVGDLTTAIRRDPKVAEAYRSRAEVYRATGKTALAIEDETQAESMSKNN